MLASTAEFSILGGIVEEIILALDQLITPHRQDPATNGTSIVKALDEFSFWNPGPSPYTQVYMRV